MDYLLCRLFKWLNFEFIWWEKRKMYLFFFLFKVTRFLHIRISWLVLFVSMVKELRYIKECVTSSFILYLNVCVLVGSHLQFRAALQMKQKIQYESNPEIVLVHFLIFKTKNDKVYLNVKTNSQFLWGLVCNCSVCVV